MLYHTLEFCSPLMIGIGKTLNKKMESINFYALRTLLGVKKDTDYELVLQMTGICAHLNTEDINSL